MLVEPMASAETTSNQNPADSQFFRNPAKQKLTLCLLLVAATLALYSPITRAPFLNYDDALHVADNPHVRAGLTWSTVVWAFRSSETADWHPITWLSHALDCQLFGLSPEGPHTVNLLLHAINAALLFLILASATQLLWRSFAVAALFALHPINVESVAWISERKDVLSTFFFFLALAAYGWYARRPGLARYLTVTAAYALALMSKAQVITFPFALLLLDYWPLHRLAPADAAAANRGHTDAQAKSFLGLLWEKAPWLALSAASAIITMKVEAAATQARLPFSLRLANASAAYVKYLEKAFWPVHLAPIYPHPGASINIAAAIASAAALIAISIFALVFRRHRPFFVGWFWFLGTLVPMIGLIQISVHSMADRYAYIPLLGIFVIVCWGAADLAARWRVPKWAPLAASAAVLLALALLLSRQIAFWSDDVTLWTHTLSITERNYTAEDNLAGALIAEGKIEEAMSHARRALAFAPDDAMATLNLSTYDQMRGNYQAALSGYSRIPLISRNASLIEQARINSGYAHMSLKQYENAQKDFAAILQSQPANAAAYRGLALAKQRGGDLAAAIRNYQQAAQFEPSALNCLLLAQALEQAGQTEAARAAQSQAATLAPNLADDQAIAHRLLTE